MYPAPAQVGAQIPDPRAVMENAIPGVDAPGDTQVVEGLGATAGWPGALANCPYSASSIEAATVADLSAGRRTITEISPQGGCGTVVTYEAIIRQILQYTQAHVSKDAFRNLWGGIMLDEEDGFGLPVTDLVKLNGYVERLFVTVPGRSWYYTENFTAPGAWTQKDFNAILSHSIPAPQIYTPSMAQMTNQYLDDRNAGDHTPVLVTWYTEDPNYYYHSRGAAVAAIRGTPYYQWGYYWTNRFCRGSCR